MANTVLENFAGQIPGLEKDIKDSEELINFLKSIGKSTVDHEQKIADSKRELKKWKDGLKDAGVTISKAV